MSPETSLSLGEFLRQERERRGITIEQVASATKINIKTLHALEGDHYSELPAKPFIRGFVTSYARFIGLDAKEILNRYDEFLNDRSKERPNRDGGHSGYAFERKDGEQQSRTILWFVMGAFMVLGVFVMVFLKPSFHRHHSSHADKLREAHPVAEASPESATAVAETAPQPSPSVAEPKEKEEPKKAVAEEKEKPSEEPAKPEEPVAAATPESATPPVAEAPITPNDPLDSGLGLKGPDIKHKLIVKALANCVVRYQVDSKPIHKFVLKKDRILVLRARENIRFQVSNPKSATVNYNGGGTKPIAKAKNLALRQDTPTLIFGTQAPETMAEPFPGESALPKTSDPAEEPMTQLSTPTP
ncbi:MAG: helix-turn-helix domain-containing protein [Bdellovibrionota bacterium]